MDTKSCQEGEGEAYLMPHLTEFWKSLIMQDPWETQHQVLGSKQTHTTEANNGQVVE